jgi:predicted MPP superfamily phosphohydrolase
LGDIDAALEGIDDERFTILLSHDPSHYEDIVSTHPQMVDLTLSGHTHAMQCGIEINERLRWSPVKYVYKYWAGLYEENGRKLYVNRGLGYHFFPARVGIRPEITLFTLHREE